MRFPQTFIDDLRRQADIVRIISDYVPLKKRGANWVACCPFHKEKTASFSVHPGKDIFYCFGCGKKGSVYNFVMEMDHLAFPEAIKAVAEKAGVPLPLMVEDKRFDARRLEADEVLKLNALASTWWETQLKADTPEAEAARKYLEGRRITDATVKTFRLGFAPESWDALSNYLKSQGVSVEAIERSGLVVKKDTGGHYDRFRGRLMFPVLDAQGRPVAFGGRTLLPDGEPKYMNSPETAAYVKGRHLYGLNITREEIKGKKFAILVEGYLDLLVPYQHGIKNVVASLGTALTPEQAKLIARFARKIVVNYDGDRAGISAAKRAIETLLAEDLEVKVLVLPENADPDEFVRSHGVEEYQKKRGEALPHIQFVVNQALRDRNLLHPADKAAAVEDALPYVRAVRNPIQKREFFDMTMNALRIEDRALRSELWQGVKGGKITPHNNGIVEDGRSEESRAAAIQPTKAEHKLLELLANNGEVREKFLPRMEDQDYHEMATSGVFGALRKLYSEHRVVDSVSLLGETEGDEVAEEIIPLLLTSKLLGHDNKADSDPILQAEVCYSALVLINNERFSSEISRELAESERIGDIERIGMLASKHAELAKRRKELLQAPEHFREQWALLGV